LDNLEAVIGTTTRHRAMRTAATIISIERIEEAMIPIGSILNL
jgi:hypothetical protein